MRPDLEARIQHLDSLGTSPAQRAENLFEIHRTEHDLEVELFSAILPHVNQEAAQTAVDTTFLTSAPITPREFPNSTSWMFFNWRWLHHIAPEWTKGSFRGVHDTVRINSPVLWTTLFEAVDETQYPSPVEDLVAFYGRDTTYAARAASKANAHFLELSTLYLSLAALFGSDFQTHVHPAKRHSLSHSHPAGVAAGNHFGSPAGSFDTFLERMQTLFPAPSQSCPIAKNPRSAIGFLADNEAFVGGWRNNKKAICRGIQTAGTLYGAYGNLLRNTDYINLITPETPFSYKPVVQ